MPIVLILAGLAVLLVALQGDPKRLFTLLSEDLSGDAFPVWIVAVLVIGAIGFIKPAQGISRLFIVLLVIVFALANGGLFAKAEAQFLRRGATSPNLNPLRLVVPSNGAAK